MFKTNSFKKTALVLSVAVCIALAFVLTACSGVKPFQSETGSDLVASAIDSNGGIAVSVKIADEDYLYYVNGYQSDSTVENTYANVRRVGEVVRVKVSDLDEIITLTEATDKKSAEIAESISEAIREKAKIVVPNVYYTANTTTKLNGIFIFNNRLYMLTPNDELTAGGASLTSQLCLNSYALNGTDKQTHVVIESNSAQVMLSNVNGDVYATIVANSALYSIKLGDRVELTSSIATAKVEDVPAGIARINESVSNVSFDVVGDEGKGVFYNDKDGSICHFVAGATEQKVLVKNEEDSGHEDHNHKTKTIKSVNNGYVYYTQADSNSSVTDNNIYWVTDDANGVLVPTAPADTYYCRGTEMYFVGSKTVSSKTVYTIYRATWDAATKTVKQDALLNFEQNDKSVTLNGVVGDVLTYTANGFTYTLDLTSFGDVVTAVDSGKVIASGLSTSSTGWSVPEVVGNYAFTLASGSVSVVKFDAVKKTNSTSADITLKDAATEE